MKERTELPPSITVVLNPRNRVHSSWYPSDQCEMGGGIQRGMISEATTGIRQHLRVPDERPIPPPLALSTRVPSEECVEQPQALGVLSVSRAAVSYALASADGDLSQWTSFWVPLMV